MEAASARGAKEFSVDARTGLVGIYKPRLGVADSKEDG
jgi:hypothetical protein